MTKQNILEKLSKYSRTPTGGKRIARFVSEKRDHGSTFANGQVAIGKKQMTEMANALADMIRAKLPPSISSVGDTLSATPPIKLTNGDYKIVLSFDKAALPRDSLAKGRGFDGIDNIVALFNNGYSKDKIGRVWGKWVSHDIYIHNKESWEGQHFMQAAVDQFNSTYGTKYGTTVSIVVNLNDDYKQ